MVFHSSCEELSANEVLVEKKTILPDAYELNDRCFTAVFSASGGGNTG
jgi:hypothetical protein